MRIELNSPNFCISPWLTYACRALISANEQRKLTSKRIMTLAAGEERTSKIEKPLAESQKVDATFNLEAWNALLYGLRSIDPACSTRLYTAPWQFSIEDANKAYVHALGSLVALGYVAYLAALLGELANAVVIAVLAVLSAGLRVSMSSRFCRNPSSNGDVSLQVKIQHIAATASGALAWAFVIVSIYPLLHSEHRVVVVLLVAISTSMAAGTMRLAPPYLIVHLTIITGAFLVGAVLRPDVHSIVSCGVFALFAAEILRTTYQTNQSALNLAAQLNKAIQAHEHEQSAVQAKLAETQSRIETTLRASSESRNLHMAKISHEFRTPLQSIVGAVDLLSAILAKNPDPRVGTTLTILNSASKQLLSSSNDLADYIRTNSTHIKIKSEQVELIGFMQSCISLHEAQAREKGLTIVFTHDAPALAYVVDAARLRQIMSNLLSNAVKYTSVGEIEIACNQDQHANILITVRDTGSGISEQGQKHIFEPWFRVDESKQGLGLGLAIVKATADAIGAKIQMHSSLGVGTTMTVVLPARRIKSNAA